MLPSNLKYFSLILLITYTHILFAQPDCIGNQFDIFGVCGGDNTIQGAIDAADIGSTINIPSGIYDESLTISKSVYLIASSEVTLNVSSYTSGITITSNTENVTISGLTISGNNLTGAGIVVQPGAKNISIVDNIITDVLLPGGGNTSPLSYGILCWGNPASGENLPTNITIDNNSILNVLGSAISLGTYSVSVSITNNNFSNILPVEIGLPAPVSIGIQSEFSTNLEVIGNTYNSLDISNNLISCLGSTLLESNTYNDSELMLNTTHPHNISMNDVPWESIVYDSSPLVFESYYSSTDAASYQELFAATVFLNTLIATSSSTLGCNDVLACNFSSDANVDDGSCTYADQYYDCDGNCLNDSDTDGVCDELEVVGCQDPVSCNYDASATDEGACTYADQYYDCDGNCLNDSDGDGVCDELEIPGCTDAEADNYNEDATDEDGSCEYLGCTNPNAENYDEGASVDDGSCIVLGCTNPAADNYNSEATDDDGSCEASGCTYPGATNYDAVNTSDDGSCIFLGCIDSEALNFIDHANSDDGSCVYEECAGESDCPFDANGDGEIGSADLLEFLVAFGQACENL